MRDQGYETAVDYTYGYYRELSPNLQRFAMLVAGFEPPQASRYLELGFGRGLSLNIHAAANPIECVGTDFMSSQALEAGALAKASGARVFEDSFEELLARPDLGEFDIIALHGIYTWVDSDRRREIRDIIRGRLKTGGMVYISYNTLPGWAGGAPLQRLYRFYADQWSTLSDPPDQRLKEAYVLANSLKEAGAGYFKANPSAVARLENAMKHPLAYGVHEYLHESWTLFYFLDLVDELRACKLDFAGSAHVLDTLERTRLPAAAREFMKEIEAPLVREQLRDYWLNAGFRKDIFARGLSRLTDAERLRALMHTRVALAQAPSAFDYKAKTGAGELGLERARYEPLIAALEESQKPPTIQDLATKLKLTPQTAIDMVAILIGVGMLAPAHDPDVTAKVKPKTRALNKLIRERAAHRDEIRHLASPVTGEAVPVGRMDQLFLSAIEAGAKTPDAWAAHATDAIFAIGQRLVRDGAPMQAREDTIAHLTEQAKTMETSRLPIFRGLGLV